jgi:hypothetical protein
VIGWRLVQASKKAWATKTAITVAEPGLAAPAAIADGETSAWVAVKVWDWFVVPKDMSDDELDDIACTQVVYGRDRWQCYGVSVSANQEVPVHRTEAF